MTCSHRYAHTNSLFKNLNILKLRDIVSLQTYLFVFKSLQCNSLDIYQPNSINQDSRRPYDVKIPLCRTAHAQSFVTYRGAKIWNQLPDDIKKLDSLHIFKAKIKQLLFHSY